MMPHTTHTMPTILQNWRPSTPDALAALTMTTTARRDFALAWYAAADFIAGHAVRLMRQHTACTLEDMQLFRSAHAAFKQAAQERDLALALLAPDDRLELLVNRPLRERLAGELLERLARFTVRCDRQITFSVSEWDDADYQGTLTLKIAPDVPAVEAEDLINAALRTMTHDDRGGVYTCHVNPRSPHAIDVTLTSLISLSAPTCAGGSAHA